MSNFGLCCADTASCLQGVAINFVKSDDIRILRDIEQYYSTQVDEMVSMFVFMIPWTVLLFMMPSVTVLILTFASVCAANECGRLDIEAAQHVWGALAVYDTYSLLAAVGESQTVVSTPSADSCVTESHSLNHCRCVLCVPFHVLLQGLHCIWHVNAFHHYWYCFAWLLWYAQSQLVKLY